MFACYLSLLLYETLSKDLLFFILQICEILFQSITNQVALEMKSELKFHLNLYNENLWKCRELLDCNATDIKVKPPKMHI